MTGLDPETDHIMEAACIVTDNHINVIAEGPNLIVHQPLEILNTMNDWCKIHHTQVSSAIQLYEVYGIFIKFIFELRSHLICTSCAEVTANSVYLTS